MINRWLIILFLILSFLGFTDATYLTVKHYTGGSLICNFLQGCDIVTKGPYATIAGIPVALLGSIYYLLIIILTVAYLDTKRFGLMKFLAPFTVVGFLASIYFVYLQIFVIGQLCEYCIISAGTSTGLFGIGLYVIKTQNLKLKTQNQMSKLKTIYTEE